jgi:hypothetical protein
MNIRTNASSGRLATLTDAWRTLRRDIPLPEPALVSLEPTINRITIQGGSGRDALDHVAHLLLWVYTLKQVNAQWWHTPDGHLHLTIQGRTGTGVAVNAYGGIPFDHCAGLVALAPGESEGVSLDEMYTLLVPLRDHHHHVTTAGVTACRRPLQTSST